jgi:hypothetical protein
VSGGDGAFLSVGMNMMASPVEGVEKKRKMSNSHGYVKPAVLIDKDMITLAMEEAIRQMNIEMKDERRVFYGTVGKMLARFEGVLADRNQTFMDMMKSYLADKVSDIGVYCCHVWKCV